MSSTLACPFTILIDTAESNPYQFFGIRSDADKKNRVFEVTTRFENLGRHPNSFGDYSIEGGFGFVSVERKSMEDAWGTLLGWPTGYEKDRELPGRRKRFESELGNLNNLVSLVVVEATMGQCLSQMPSWGVKSEATNAKIFYRTVISYQQRFPCVQWAFCDTRRLAEVTCFRWLYRFWKKELKCTT